MIRLRTHSVDCLSPPISLFICYLGCFLHFQIPDSLLHNSFSFGLITTLKKDALPLPLLPKVATIHSTSTTSSGRSLRMLRRMMEERQARELLQMQQLVSLPCDHFAEEEDYIDMDVSSAVDVDLGGGGGGGSTASFICYTMASPPLSKEFEFQMSGNPTEREATTSPADELFYKGKLLPLHLPPRLRMVEKLLESSKHSDGFGEKDVSAAVGGELSAVSDQKQSPWSKKLKSIKQSSLGLKLKASRSYLKSVFIRSRCSDESCAQGKYVLEDTNAASLRSTEREKLLEEDLIHRKSFSGASSWSSTTKPSSSSTTSSCSSSLSSSFSSSSSLGVYQPQMLKRSSSVNSEMESSIQGAIAYCKESQQLVGGRKSASDAGLYPLPASRIAAACQARENPRFCRG
ncbi:unnamed protein product [Musa banksii]